MTAIFELIKDIIFFGGYINSNKDSFLKPLSAEKEEECIKRMAEGDEQARCMLIEHNLRLVAHIAKKYAKNSGDTEDYISIGTIGLIKGINTFDISKGKLASYISRCVENEIRMYLRSAKKLSLEVSLCDPIGEDDDGSSISFMDILTSQESDVEDKVDLIMQTEKLKEILDRTLTPRERLVIGLRYGLDGDILPQRLIAKRLGISRSYISRIEKNALMKLKKSL